MHTFKLPTPTCRLSADGREHDRRELRPRCEVQFLKRMRDVGFDGPPKHVEMLADLAVGETVGQNPYP